MKFNKYFFLVLSTSTLVFIIIYTFFVEAHPIIPWDGDDWGTLSAFNRTALPTWGTKIPIRIFPEIFGPIAGYFAAFVVYPIEGDYIHSITITVGLIIALFTTLFYLSLYKLFYDLSKKQVLSICLALLVLVLYFFLFKKKPDNNYYMFWPYNLCTVFYYLLPNILNSTLVCYFMSKSVKGELSFSMDIRTGILIFILYFAMFSMLWGCSILAVYSFYEIISSILNREGRNLRDKIKTYWRQDSSKNRIYFLILLLFIVYCVFEFFGTRTADLVQNTETAGFFQNLISSFLSFGSLAIQMKIIFLIFSFVIFIAAIILYIRSKEQTLYRNIIKMIKICLISGISLMFFYLIVSTKAGRSYAGRIESVYGVYFFCIMIVVLCVMYIILKLPKLIVLFPLVLSILFIETTRSSKPYRGSFYTDTTAYQRYIITSGFIKQIQQADIKGEKSITIKYPKVAIWFNDLCETLDLSEAIYLSKALFAHNITTKKMDIKFEQIDAP
jgi:hypothetical protein